MMITCLLRFGQLFLKIAVYHQRTEACRFSLVEIVLNMGESGNVLVNVTYYMEQSPS
jgi:hypothetical protein